MKSLEERFIAKVDKDTKTGCWEWTASTNGVGYGQIGKWVGHKKWTMASAHRVSYELYKGSIGDFYVLHTCDNTKCVNPEHLFLGTAKDNMRDKISKGRHPKKYNVLSQEIANLIRKEKGTQKQIAEKFGISVPHVSNIKNNKIWRMI